MTSPGTKAAARNAIAPTTTTARPILRPATPFQQRAMAASSSAKAAIWPITWVVASRSPRSASWTPSIAAPSTIRPAVLGAPPARPEVTLT